MVDWSIGLEEVTPTLLEEVRNLDCKEYPEFVVDLKWYLDNYKNLEFIITCRDKHNALIGYVCITGLDFRVYTCYKEGLLRGDISLAPKSFKPLKGENSLYLSMICVDTLYQRKGIAKELVVRSIDTIKSKLGVNFNILAICTVKHSENLLLGLNFEKVHDFGDRSIVELKHYKVFKESLK